MIYIFDELFFLIVTIALMTKKMYFSCLHGNHCQGNKFLQQNYAAYQSKISLIKLIQTDKDYSRKTVGKFYHLPHS